MTSFAIGDAFIDVLVLVHVHHEGWSTQQHLSIVYSVDYDTWIVPDARTKILSLTIRTNQGHGSWQVFEIEKMHVVLGQVGYAWTRITNMSPLF